jgi:hypothetical protein
MARQMTRTEGGAGKPQARHQRGEKPPPTGTYIGVGLALGGTLLFMVLMATGVISVGSKPQAQAQAPKRQTPGAAPVTVTQPAGTPARPVAPGVAAPARIAFTGQFSKTENTRRIEITCPNCAKAIDPGIPKCPFCSTGVSWPDRVKCGFCSGEKPGGCGVCGGEGRCPFCKNQPRMLFGMGQGCDSCSQSMKCPACDGTGKCVYCEEGWYRPGYKPATRPAKRVEETIPKPQPEGPARREPDTIPKPEPAPDDKPKT